MGCAVCLNNCGIRSDVTLVIVVFLVYQFDYFLLAYTCAGGSLIPLFVCLFSFKLLCCTNVWISEDLFNVVVQFCINGTTLK